MQQMWDDSGYTELNLCCQNLRDQAARLEKIDENVRETTTRNEDGSEKEIKEHDLISGFGEPTINTSTFPDTGADLHTVTSTQFPEEQINIPLSMSGYLCIR